VGKTKRRFAHPTKLCISNAQYGRLFQYPGLARGESVGREINANGARGAKVANALETLAPFASLASLALNFYGYPPDLQDAAVRTVF